MKCISSAFCKKECRLKRSSYVAVNASASPLQTAATACCAGKVSLISAVRVIIINTFRHYVVKRQTSSAIETGGKNNYHCATNCKKIQRLITKV
jgi:hypothetical protein